MREKKKSTSGAFEVKQTGEGLIGKVMEAGIILVVAGAALLFSVWSKNNFLLPKEIFAESILIILFGIYLIRVIEKKVPSGRI